MCNWFNYYERILSLNLYNCKSSAKSILGTSNLV